ncbi:cryptochrome/photolyase family protein [Agrilutibacter solisilvae]|uniref:Deoxyribodipyrimidine photo-lyase n=1 Tax=Agrilutibacter solisilvae TaxID=2763317 RepID=A0A974XXD5_9GAMM|nr:deoxyribodipyrimidine photo-lyase [Lysobacter solisilvae]QSX77576.1 deoxyribodipyrimidine photo-lyase [Lysobacter solisilvae]
MSTAILWFRNDLRLADNPALQALLRGDFTALPVYVHAPGEEGAWAPGAASDAWRRRSLQALDAQLRALGSRLHVFTGPTLDTLARVAQASGAQAVFWNRRYEPAIEARDAVVKRALRSQGLRAESHDAALLFEPWQVQTRQGDPYRVFTPFWRTALSQWRLPPESEAPRRLPAPAPTSALDEVELDLILPSPAPRWDAGFWSHWTPGEGGAREAMTEFATQRTADYALARDRPAVQGTSRLSPHLHFGEISPWRIVRALESSPAAEREAFVRELGWREFAHHVLHHFPHTPEANFNPRFDDFPWAEVPPAHLDAWRHGHTGVPLVDAGMRELWHTGWMHNRVRMVVASFLVKNLRGHWRHGARWFWDTLVDADLANNTLGWQWAAGTGVDASPYVRVFNPTLQAQRFDPQGEYIARWLPGFERLPAALRHEPWRDPAAVAAVAPDYPRQPVVDLARSRQDALEAFARSRALRT